MFDVDNAAAKNVLAYIRSLTAFKDKSWEQLYPALSIVTFKKGEYLLEEGKVCQSLFYISEGYCRAYYNKDGKDINTAFFFENDMATNVSSFGQGEPSEYAIQAMEPLTAVKFDKQLLFAAAGQDPDIQVLGRKCLQMIAAKQEKHAAIYKLMSGQERYEYMETNFPELLQRVSLSHLSSWLGVARETLSRIRGRRE
ncbi:MAG: Crp/Fnr family transcriptional regulator [Chitinophaga sp.]|uniref:Crp/Fnr family transcriptional regulator n=1 Tax=Chitinophaga sp. TaxID=1869181 RepID=UPI001B065F44|nr:Crp/Fnr family transcriptional regulator [Chitinophaga sp.]MBO9728321.1 Crp/Fnr family transcriptional regulator [Chitinophaga sp.]